MTVPTPYLRNKPVPILRLAIRHGTYMKRLRHLRVNHHTYPAKALPDATPGGGTYGNRAVTPGKSAH